MNSHKTNLIRAAIEGIKRLFKRKPDVPEDDPYAYVTAPKKPRPPIAAPLPWRSYRKTARASSELM